MVNLYWPIIGHLCCMTSFFPGITSCFKIKLFLNTNIFLNKMVWEGSILFYLLYSYSCTYTSHLHNFLFLTLHCNHLVPWRLHLVTVHVLRWVLKKSGIAKSAMVARSQNLSRNLKKSV